MRSQRNRTDGRAVRQKGLQAKHLNEDGVIQIVEFVIADRGFCSWFDVHRNLAVFVHVPQRVVLAKLRAMLRKGKIDWLCDCGCSASITVIK